MCLPSSSSTPGLGYQPLRNADGNEVLAATMLLDRRYKRPKLDHENRRGHTALTTACCRGQTQARSHNSQNTLG